MVRHNVLQLSALGLPDSVSDDSPVIVDLDEKAAIATLTMNCPSKMNAMDTNFILGFRACLRWAEDSLKVRGILVRGNGKAFSAGLNLEHVLSLPVGDAEHFFHEHVSGMFRDVAACAKPVAAIVGGHALAGGLVLMLCCDHVVLAGNDFKLGLTELAVGVPFPPVVAEICKIILTPRAFRLLAADATIVNASQLFELGVGDILTKSLVEGETAALNWLRSTTARPLAAFSLLKEQKWRNVLQYGVHTDIRAKYARILQQPEVRALIANAVPGRRARL